MDEIVLHRRLKCTNLQPTRNTSHKYPLMRTSVRLSVNHFFKNLLLQNQMVNLDKTWQECSLDEDLQKLLKEFNSIKISGCHGIKMAENGKNLQKSSCEG